MPLIKHIKHNWLLFINNFNTFKKKLIYSQNLNTHSCRMQVKTTKHVLFIDIISYVYALKRLLHILWTTEMPTYNAKNVPVLIPTMASIYVIIIYWTLSFILWHQLLKIFSLTNHSSLWFILSAYNMYSIASV